MAIRIVAAVAVLISAIIHLEQWILVFRDTPYVGPAMLTNFIVGLIIVALLLWWRTSRVPWALTVLFGAATLGAFLISATVGLFGVHEHWTIWEVWVAAIVEVVAIITGLVGFAQRPAARR